MKVSFNPNAAAHNPNARPPQTQTTPTTTAPTGSGDGVEITLSPLAQQALKAGASEYTGNSPAHQARQYIAQSLAGASAEGADGPDLSGPFGQIVKTFAHAKHTTGSGDTVPEDGGETAGVTAPTDGSDGTGEVADGGDGTGTPPADGGDGTTVVEGSDASDGSDGTDATDGAGVVEGSEGSDGSDSTVVAGDPDGIVGDTDPPPIVDEGPDITEVLEEPAPAEGEVTEPESGLAGSGDAVASSGDDAPVDDGTPVGSSEPVTVVDGGDLTDELLDLLDGGDEEIV